MVSLFFPGLCSAFFPATMTMGFMLSILIRKHHGYDGL